MPKLRGLIGSDAASALAKGDVLDVEGGVFDLPVISGQGQQLGRSSLVGVQAGQGVDDLDGAAVAQFASALDAADLARAGPDLIEPGGDRPHGDDAGLDAAVALVEIDEAAQASRIATPIRLARNRSHP